MISTTSNTPSSRLKATAHPDTLIKNLVNRYIQNWRLFAFMLLISVCGAAIYASIAKPIYNVKSSLIIENDASNSKENAVLKEINLSSVPKKSETEIELIKSRKLVTRVVRSLSRNRGFSDTTRAINYYLANLEAILVDKNGPLIQLSINHSDLEASKAFLNALMTSYISEQQARKNDLTQRTLSFINERLYSLSRELNTSEKNIAGYKSELGLTDIPSESAIYLQNDQKNSVDLNKVDLQLKVINNIEEYSNKEGNSALPSTIGIEDPGLVSLVGQLAKLQLEKNKLLATTPESNYIFQSINSQIQTTKSAIKENVRNIKSSLLSMRDAILQVKGQVRSSIKSLPGQERGYVSIKRQQAIKENLYTYLLQKREEIALSYASIVPEANIIDYAYVSAIVWPKKVFVFALALFFAVLFTTIIVFIKDFFNDKVMQAEEIHQSVSIPVVSQLSYIDTESSIVVVDKAKTAIAEQFRRLRTNLHFLHGSKKTGRVTLITSSISGEGKSFVTANLGILLAGAGRRTIILDLDLHRPKLHKIFGLDENKGGIGNYLKGKNSFNAIVQSMDNIPNLDVISAGPEVENPSELLERGSLDELIVSLRQNYDDIIFDCPPLNIVNDALILSRLADVSLYVVRKNITQKTELMVIDQLHRDQRLPNMSIIFNCVNQSNAEVIY